MIAKLYRKFRTKKNEKNFRAKSCVGENITLLCNSVSVNTGAKDNIKIGNHGFVGGVFQALCGGKIEVGNNIYIGTGTFLQAKESIKIGNNVIISNNVLIVDNNNHPVEPCMRLKMSQCDNYMTDELWTWKYAESAPIIIEDNVWIGKNAVIMKGVTVGKGSIVALGAIVTHDVPPYSVVAGNPAKVVKRLEETEA
jgi:acetyltransferase-like isoleucine patch superfamily enzyme